MLKIVNKNQFYHYNMNKVEYALENGILLFEEDWNGEGYRKGFDVKTEKVVKNCYKPIYKEIEPDNFEIIGFK